MTEPAQPAAHYPPLYTYEPPAPPAAAVATPSVSPYVGPALGILGAILIIAGSLMPWATVQSIFGTMSLNGTEGDGIITLLAGIGLAAGAGATAAFQRLWLAIAQAITAGGVAALSLYEINHVTSSLDDAGNELARASAGSGLYVLLIGAVVAVLGGCLHIGLRAQR